MKSFFSLLLTVFIGTAVLAQRATPDQLETAEGKLSIQPILHGSVVLTWDGRTIYVDPYGGTKAFKDIAAPDLILITDIHGDHLNQATLDSINTSNRNYSSSTGCSG